MKTTVSRAFKFRLYPTEAQAAELAEWERQLRRLYNLAHEQRLAALARPQGERPGQRRRELRERARMHAARWVAHLGAKRTLAARGELHAARDLLAAARADGGVDYYRQSREMTELLTVDEQLARVVCSARQEILRDLDKAWQRFWKRLGGKPHFKRRTDSCRIYLSTPKHWRVEAGVLVLSGAASPVGPIQMRQDRPWPGDAKFSSCALVRDVDEWYAVFPLQYSTELERGSGMVGINRGAIHAIADSEGRVVDSPAFYGKALERVKRRARELQKKQPGSRNRYKAAQKLARAHRAVRRQREWWLHEQSAHYATRYKTIAIEDMGTKKILQRPSQDAQHNWSTTCRKHECGKPVHKQRLCKEHYEEQRYIPKSAVRRSILDVGWYELGRQLEYKAQARGGEVVKVNPGPMPARQLAAVETQAEAGISKQCSSCGATLAKSASGSAIAYCEACLNTELGDTNAARNVLLRAMLHEPAEAKTPKVSIKIKGRAKAQTKTAAKPAAEACGGDPLVEGPVETGTLSGDG